MDARRQEKLIEELSGHVNRWGLVAPGIALLEANKPFSFLGSQLLLFVEPLLNFFVSPAVTSEYVSLLEDRDNVERLIRQLEIDASHTTLEDALWK
jgi:hypothetical protein